MRMVIVGIVLCLGINATAAAQDSTGAKGEKVFTEQKCILCHSIGAKGNKKGPLDGVGSKLPADEMRSWIVDAKGMTAKTKSTRTPAMKSYVLPDADVNALVAYMVTLKK